MSNRYDKATFYPRGRGRNDRETVGTFVREDGATLNGGLIPLQDGESASGEVVEIRPVGDGTFDARFLDPNSQRGWTPAYESGWERIFGTRDAPEA